MVSNADGYAIDLRQVTKIYRRRVHALQGITMQVKRGEIFGLLGPNGAGKSTLVKIMMTVVRPTHAEGMILGHPVGHKPTLKKVGYLPENHRFPKYLTGRQTIDFFSAMAGVDRATRQKRTAELLDTVGMTEWGDKKIAEYSKGMLQRIGIAQALGPDPDLVVLDEPTDGVDPSGRRDIRDVLLRMRQNGKTVFVNSHLLSELETVCDRVAILVQGTVARQGTIDELTIAKQCYLFEIEAPQIWQTLAGALPGVFDAAEIARRVAMASAPPPMPLAPGQMPPPMQFQNPATMAPLMAPAMPPAMAPSITTAPLPTMQYQGPPMPFGSHLAPPIPAAPAVGPLKGKLRDGMWIDFDGRSLRVGYVEAAAVQGLLDDLRRANITIRKMNVLRQSLEDLFFEAITDSATGQLLKPGAANPSGHAANSGARP
jgi:ABC-2 type transport system ATP-binding protein